MVSLVKRGDGVYELNLRGYTCPYPVTFTKRYFSGLERGSLLHIIIDNAPSCETVPAAIEELGGEVVAVEYLGNGVFRVVAKKP